MTETLTAEQIQERTAEIVLEINRLAAHDELTKTQTARFDALKDELRQLDMQSLRNTIDSGGVRLEDGAFQAPQPHTQAPKVTSTVRDSALRMIDARDDVPDHARQRVVSLFDEAKGDELDLVARWTRATLNPDYERAIVKLFRDPQNGHREFSTAELSAYQEAKTVQRAMSLTDASGGYLVPFTLDPNIMLTSAGSINPLRQLARIETTATDTWSGITSAGVTASWDAEASEVSDDSPTLAQPTITVHKAAAFVAASIEVAGDSNIGQQVGGLFSDAKDQLEATAFTLGTGSGQPKGIITAVAAVPGSVVTSAGSALTVADVTANQNALPARWRPRAQWMANLAIINQGRQLPLYTNGPALVSDASGTPQMMGWRINENSVMDGTIAAGTTNDYALLSGDFKQFCIVDRIGATIEYIPHLFGANGRPTGQRGWYMYWRSGSDVLIPDAFRLTNYSG